MSYVTLVTDSFDEVVQFYGKDLGFPAIAAWDRAGARGRRFDLGGLQLEILDNLRERTPRRLNDPGERFHLVVEVADIEVTRTQLNVDAPSPLAVSWGARLFQVRDPDGVPVTFLQWDQPKSEQV